MEEEKEPSDTLYSVSADAPDTIANVILRQTTVSERKEIERKKTLLVKMRKVSSKSVLAGIENLDAILGSFSYACGVIFYELARQGKYLDAVFFGIGFLISIVLKHRVAQGPVVSLLEAPTAAIKSKFMDLSRTILH